MCFDWLKPVNHNSVLTYFESGACFRQLLVLPDFDLCYHNPHLGKDGQRFLRLMPVFFLLSNVTIMSLATSGKGNLKLIGLINVESLTKSRKSMYKWV